MAYTIEEREDTAIVVFPEFADARRTATHEKQLRDLVRSKSRVVFDLSHCKIVDTPWLRLITTLSKQADALRRYVAVAGANEETLRSADYLGHRTHLHIYTTVEEALKS